jgi:flagellar assembly protein FliH
MDPLTNLVAEATANSPLIGILYAEDFDDVPNQPIVDAEASAEPVETPLTQDDLDRACAAAVAAAKSQWENEAQQIRTNLIGIISTALAAARDAAEQIALETAEAAVATILAMLSGALPHFCNEHGNAEVRALVDRLLPTLRTEPRVVVRVHPDLVPELRREFLDLQADISGTLVVNPAAVERGDVKIEWENGALSRDTRQILQAMQDALGQLGLQQPRELTPKRRMAHAE